MKKIASPLFQDLSEAELDTLAAAGHLRTRQFAKHEVIFRAGSCVWEIGIVLRGSVHIENLDLWGTKSILSSVGAGQAFAETYATAKNASYNAAADQVEEGTVQVTFDADAAQKLVAQAQPGQEITVPAQIQQPKVSKAALEKVLFRDVLASCTTYVSGAWGRIQNVRKAAQNISGTVLNCGDQFSYNDAIGPTTADYGFYAAPGYVGGKTVDVYGGGVCQVSSTLYYATLKADLEIVMRYCHQYAPGYIKWGCDATVYDGFPDFIFANNTDYPIKIVTYWNDNNVTVEILGTKVDDSYVEMVSETVDVIPWETVYEETDELAPGEKQEIQTPYTGYVVQTWRNVYAGDGSLLSSTFEATSNYESRDQIIRIGKAKP